MRIISLTSIPPRFAYIGQALQSLIVQGSDEVRLYIPQSYERFPDWDGSLPKVPKGVRVVRCPEDFGPATKILAACQDLSGNNVQILFCDDDCIVPKGWAKHLFDLQAKRAGEAVAVYVRPAQGYISNAVRVPGWRAWQLPIRYDLPYRASRLASKMFGTPTFQRRPFIIPGYGEIFFGVCGVVVRPEFFDAVAYDIPDIARPVDDVWLSANLARKGISIYCPWMAALPAFSDSTNIAGLLTTAFYGKSRQELNSAAALHCQKNFGIWQ